MQRLDIGDLADLVMVAPGEEPLGGPVISHAGIFVADGGGEEFEEAARGLVAGGGDNARHETRGVDRPGQSAGAGGHESLRRAIRIHGVV